jgi:hypothetical protein
MPILHGEGDGECQFTSTSPEPSESLRCLYVSRDFLDTSWRSQVFGSVVSYSVALQQHIGGCFFGLPTYSAQTTVSNTYNEQVFVKVTVPHEETRDHA